MSFNNKVILITGAGSGIGAATAKAFAEKSAKLSLIDINEQNLEITAEACKAKKVEVLNVAADLTKDEDVKRSIDSTVRKFGKIDIVVNCAGICGSGSILDPDLLKKFDETIAINLRTTIAITNAVAPQLIETKGNIINISSVCASLTTKYMIPYNVAKAGLTHFTKSAALELADKGVRVNCISPGYVKTPFMLNSGVSDAYIDAALIACAHIVPLKRVLEPEEIAELALFLASDKASGITGSDYAIDGGVLLTGLNALSEHKFY
ncbi:putative oxidoreductase yxbG [Papilio machaon]|uniref:Putative oxidoreductase yxbG n=1 Tax=Papilio machaon TaxID=76193 RepID=A0A0N0PDE1_PAPMA|nr:putative oxidoreductase yxbG [Papilio machaon]